MRFGLGQLAGRRRSASRRSQRSAARKRAIWKRRSRSVGASMFSGIALSLLLAEKSIPKKLTMSLNVQRR
jgi:hypothetical protein